MDWPKESEARWCREWERSLQRQSISPTAPLILLAHDRELDDVRALLEGLGLGFVDRCDGVTSEDRGTPWDLVLATPARMLEMPGIPHRSEPIRIAVLDQDDAVSLLALQESGVELIVRRPVHAAALRLLILHSLYRGPEKRGPGRVSVGATVSYRQGLRRRSAILADLSVRGCRLLSHGSVKVGKRIKIHLPRKLLGGSALTLRGKVMRAETPREREDDPKVFAVRFETSSGDRSMRLEEAVQRFATGPAVFTPAGVGSAADRPTPDAQSGESAALELELTNLVPEPEVLVKNPEERRVDPRRAYTRRMIALGEEATRVLIGRDISLGGMRVDPHPLLQPNDELEIALHLRQRSEPTLLRVRVERDDGEAGLVLRFVELDLTTQNDLRKMLSVLPILAPRRDQPGVGNGVLVSQIVRE
ncbi:MAG: PilZ domain-containing protein [Myxococcota bacterium]